MSRVCAIHNEYCADGNCRWCESPAPTPDTQNVVLDFRYGFAMHQPAHWTDQPKSDPNDGHGAFE